MEKTLEVGNRLMTKIALYKTRITEEKAKESAKKVGLRKQKQPLDLSLDKLGGGSFR
jgi:hypothetical protein